MKTTTRRSPGKHNRRGQRTQPVRWQDQVAAVNVLMPDPEKVLAYCREHPGLSRELPRIAARAREFFGDEPELWLELYQDPEIDDRHLIVYVRSCVHENLIDRIEQLSSELLHDTWDDRLGYILLMPVFLKARP